MRLNLRGIHLVSEFLCSIHYSTEYVLTRIVELLNSAGTCASWNSKTASWGDYLFEHDDKKNSIIGLNSQPPITRLTWLPEAYIWGVFSKSTSRNYTQTHITMQTAYSVSWMNHAQLTWSSNNKYTHTHPSLARQERNTQVVSIIYLKSLFPSRHSSSSLEEDQKYTYRTGWRGSGEQRGRGNRQTTHNTPESFSRHFYRTVFLR